MLKVCRRRRAAATGIPLLNTWKTLKHTLTHYNTLQHILKPEQTRLPVHTRGVSSGHANRQGRRTTLR